MSPTPLALARELAAAYAAGQMLATPPSAQDPTFDLLTAYRVEAELTRLRRERGALSVGRKVGFANRALWRKFKLDTVLWARMYDDTVHYAAGNTASLGVERMISPKIEPEIVFRLKHPPVGDLTDPAVVLGAVEWLALGFEIVDCVFQDWKFQPPDFVAAYGFHAGLVVGEPRTIEPRMIPALAERLAVSPVRLLKNGQVSALGSSANVLENPALCLGELSSGLLRQPEAEPLAAGELIATGAMTDNQFIAAGESWSATVDGLDLPELTLRLTT